MAEKKVKIWFEVDGVTQSVNSVEELNEALNNNAKATKKASDEQGYFAKQLDDIKDRLKGFKATFGEIGKGFGVLSGGLTKIAKGFGLSGRAAQVFGKVTAGAIAATGIGLLIVAVGSLINYFTNLEGGAKALKKVMAGLGAIVTNISKAFSLVVQGKFGEAFDVLKNSVTEATAAVDSQFEAERKLAELRKKTIVENAQLNQSIEKNKKVLEDSTLSANERLAALEKVNAATRKLQQNQIDDTKLALEAAQAQLTLANNFEERRDKELEIAELQAQLIDQQTQLQNIEYDAARVAREIRQQEADALKKQQEDEAAAAAKKAEDEKKAAEEREKQRQAELEAEKKASEEALKIAKAEADEKKALEEAVAQSKTDIANAALATITQIAGEQSVLGKAAAVSAATMNTYQAATNALANTPAPPPFPQIAAGVTIAQGLLQVKNILKTQTPGDSAGISAPSIAAPTAPSFDPTQASTAIGNQNPGDVMTFGQQGTQPVIKAYVLESEVTSAQEANKKIDDLARL